MARAIDITEDDRTLAWAVETIVEMVMGLDRPALNRLVRLSQIMPQDQFEAEFGASPESVRRVWFVRDRWGPQQ